MSVSQSVRQSKWQKTLYGRHPSTESRNQEDGGTGESHVAYLSNVNNPALTYLSLFFKGIVNFINLPSHYSFRRMDDKWAIRTVTRVLYTNPRPAVTTARSPIRPGYFRLRTS